MADQNEFPHVECRDERVNKALEIAWRFSQIGGEHHKTWAIDQMVRALCGSEEVYKQWVAEYTKPLSGDVLDYYEWNTGIAP